MLRVKIFTLYPDLFPGPLNIGLYKKARENHIWSLDIINIRDYALDKHKTVDDKPYGGGSGMVMRPDVLSNAVDKNINFSKEKTIYLSPKGKVFNQNIAKKMSKEKNINIICGHFEGIDQRLLDAREIEEISLGDYVLSGGETASFVFLDSILRLLPNVLGNKESLIEESFEKGLLEHPHYTKPEKWEKKRPPDVLLSGDHAKINDWRLSQSEDITRRQRPDLWKKYLEKKMKNIEEINKQAVKKIIEARKIPEFAPGDTIKVGVKILEGKRERVQYYEGVCIAKKNRDINSSFTVRKISFGEGVERTFALYSPILSSIKVVRSGKVRRAKLYYLRDRKGKSARIAEKIKKKIGIDVSIKNETQQDLTQTESPKKSEVKAKTDELAEKNLNLKSQKIKNNQNFMSKTLYDKIWEDHLVHQQEDGTSLLYVDRHLVHEVTSPQAFEGLRIQNRKVRRPELTLAVPDHNVPTTDRSKGIDDKESRIQVETLRKNCKDFGVRLFDVNDKRQGIVHIIGPEQGFTQPGNIIVCGDSHTATHGAFGALAFGIGTSEVEHVLATQTLIQKNRKILE